MLGTGCQFPPAPNVLAQLWCRLLLSDRELLDVAAQAISGDLALSGCSRGRLLLHVLGTGPALLPSAKAADSLTRRVGNSRDVGDIIFWGKWTPSAPTEPTSRKPVRLTARSLRKPFASLAGALQPAPPPRQLDGSLPAGRPPLRHRDDPFPGRCPLLRAAAHRPHAVSLLTRGRRATACCTRSFTARNANPTPSSADMLPALHIPRDLHRGRTAPRPAPQG